MVLDKVQASRKKNGGGFCIVKNEKKFGLQTKKNGT